MSDRLDVLWKLYLAMNEWIRFSDAKAGAVIAGNGAVAAIAFARLGPTRDYLMDHPWLLIAYATAVILNAFSVYFAFTCLRPILSFGPPSSPLFFGHIGQLYATRDEYEAVLRQLVLDERRFFSELSHQIYINAQIARRKFVRVSIAIWFLGGALVAYVLALTINLRVA